MKTVVVYKSKTGFTKKYAEWIAKDLSADLFEASKFKADSLVNYDTVIFGGSLHAAGIIGVKLIKKNLDKLKDKKVVVFSTGASPARMEVLNEVKNRNFTEGEQNIIKFFYLRGGFDYSKLKSVDKVLMTMMKWKLKRKKKETLTADERGMLASYNRPVDFTRKKYTEQLISYVNS
ncbi:MAG: flavodoxin domain-containing protein [Bacillota bacterium]|nr:flavodoxin domain-containing protein [Bacillota bacterium]